VADEVARWQAEFRRGLRPTDLADPDQVADLDDASGSHRKLDPAEGIQDAQLDNGARLHIVHGDVGREGHLLVNIRKFTGVNLSQ